MMQNNEGKMSMMAGSQWDMVTSSDGDLRFGAAQSIPADPRLREALRFMEEKLTQRFQIQDVADHIEMSVRWLYAEFRKVYDCSPAVYIERLRLERAEELLREKRIPISEVASSVGYADTSYFCRRFKRRYGVSPLKYRLGGHVPLRK